MSVTYTFRNDSSRQATGTIDCGNGQLGQVANIVVPAATSISLAVSASLPKLFNKYVIDVRTAAVGSVTTITLPAIANNNNTAARPGFSCTILCMASDDSTYLNVLDSTAAVVARIYGGFSCTFIARISATLPLWQCIASIPYWGTANDIIFYDSSGFPRLIPASTFASGTSLLSRSSTSITTYNVGSEQKVIWNVALSNNSTMTFNGANDTITVGTSRLHSIDVQFITNNSNSCINFRCYVNGVVLPGLVVTSLNTQNSAAPGYASMNFKRYFNAGDTIYFTGNQRSTALVVTGNALLSNQSILSITEI